MLKVFNTSQRERLATVRLLFLPFGSGLLLGMLLLLLLASLGGVQATAAAPVSPFSSNASLDRIANALERIAVSLEVLAKTRKADAVVR